MNLGEKIYNLRTQNNLSQGDLAEKLGVSRQSISKWENNSAVPDLEKIIKLSDIFGVSIDSMIKGGYSAEGNTVKEDVKPQESTKVEYVKIIEKQPMEGRKIAGIILLCMAFVITFGILFLAGSLGVIIYAAPFILCGIICFIVKSNTGLWCCWTLYIVAEIFLRYATGINISLVKFTFQYTPEMNYMRLIIAWVWLVLMAALVVYTVFKLKNKPVKEMLALKRKLVAGWTVYLTVSAVRFMLNRYFWQSVILPLIMNNGALYMAVNMVLDIALLVAFTMLAADTIRYIKNKKI